MTPPENDRREAIVEKTRQVNTYADLWHASRVVLKKGQNDQLGSAWQFLSSAILTAFAFEAFMNHAGSRLFENWPDLEVLSPEKKCRHICLHLGINLGGRGERPLQSVLELTRFRNTLAHAKSELIREGPIKRPVDDDLDGFLGKRPQTDWEAKIQNDGFARRAREDVECVLKLIQEAMPEPKDDLFFSGISTSSGTVVGPR